MTIGMSSPRPFKRETIKKVGDALDALKAGLFMIGPVKHLSGDLAELELNSSNDLPFELEFYLNEILAADPLQCYAGCRPPQRSYEREIQGLELWAYSWQSRRCGKRMYLKFALKNGTYVHVDCHQDRGYKEE